VPPGGPQAAAREEQLRVKERNDTCFHIPPTTGSLRSVSSAWPKLSRSSDSNQLSLRSPSRSGSAYSSIAKLATGDWIRRRQDLLITGKTGTGKSWLACALGHKACRDDRLVLYHRVPRLLDALALARGDGRYARLLKSLARVELLILDDWGLAPLTSQQGRDLLEIVDDRHGRASTIVTSQLPVDHWHEVIVDPTIADAILDRLVHTAHRIALDGETLRKPPEKSGKHAKLDTDTAE